MTTLVTGANGFVGAAVVRALLADGRPVRALVRAASDCSNLETLPVETVQGDLNDAESLRAAVAGCRFVMHVAADYRLWAPDAGPMYETNVQGSLRMLEAAAEARVERMVYTSSVAVLGSTGGAGPADEETPVTVAEMIGPYKRSKFLAEQAVRERAAELGFALVTVNPSTPIGPGDVKPTPTGRIIVDAANGRIPAFVDTGLNIVHVDDVARGHLLALDRGKVGERYILGGTDMSLQDILGTIVELTGRRAPRIRLPRRAVYPLAVCAESFARLAGGEPLISRDAVRMAAKPMYFSSSRAERELGYTSVEPGVALADALEWFQRHGYVDQGR